MENEVALCREVEAALRAEAVDFAAASRDLNPYGEAEAREIAGAWAIYCGQFSETHGIFGWEFAPEPRELEAALRFFQDKERALAFWVTSFADRSLRDWAREVGRPLRTETVYCLRLKSSGQESLSAASTPNLETWPLAFTRARNPAATEADLLALTKLHQRNTRFSAADGFGSYTYFHLGSAWIPFLHPALFSAQRQEAEHFRAPWLATASDFGEIPRLYERILYELV
jgi:hypothetical protein